MGKGNLTSTFYLPSYFLQNHHYCIERLAFTGLVDRDDAIFQFRAAGRLVLQIRSKLTHFKELLSFHCPFGLICGFRKQHTHSLKP